MSTAGHVPEGPDGAEILVVEDDAASMRLVTTLLAKAGYKVRPAGDGALALRSAQARPPALVLLDIKLPWMDGFEVCRQLKANGNTAKIPVIFLSGLNEDKDKGRAFEAGGVDYVTKPIRREELLARVGTHLRIVRALRQLTEARDRARQILDVAATMLVALDSEGRVTLVNRKGCEFLGRAESDILDKDWFENFLPADERSAVREAFSRMLSGGLDISARFENSVLVGNGEVHVVEWANSVLRDAHGAVTGVLSSGLDMSLALEVERLRAVNAECRADVNTAHEIDTQLASVLYNLEGLAEDLPKRATAPQDSARLDETIARLAEALEGVRRIRAAAKALGSG